MTARTLAAVLACGVLAACHGQAPSEVQTWEFTLDTPAGASTTAAAACAADGACTARAWTLASPATDGCLLQLSFTARFTGAQVDLSDFARAPESTCTGPGIPRADSTGRGTADAAYPRAAAASGELTLGFVGVFYTPSGPPRLAWRARRVSP